MAITTRPRAKELNPTDQYKTAMYGLKCGDRNFAEDFLRRQLERARAVHEAFDIAAKLGWLSEKGMTSAGFTPTQLSLPVGDDSRSNNGQGESGNSRLEFVQHRLAQAQNSGLQIGTLVTEIGKHENASYRDLNWRRPVMAELNEYADVGDITRVDYEDRKGESTRFYHSEYAPSTTVS